MLRRFFFLALIPFAGFSQIDLQSTDSTSSQSKGPERFQEFLITGLFDYTFPQGNYGDRYYAHPGVGAGFYFKTRNDLYFGLDGVYLFADRVRDQEVISNLYSSGGYVISGSGGPASVAVNLRGFKLNFLKVGKLLLPVKLFRGNIHSGIVGMIGGGIIQHKYNIVVTSGTAPQLSQEYKKGYDKLTNGFVITPMLGYFYYDQQKFINFFIGVEYMYSWTQNRRDWNHIDMKKDDTQYNDRGWVFKLGWFIPLRKRKSRDYYYF